MRLLIALAIFGGCVNGQADILPIWDRVEADLARQGFLESLRKEPRRGSKVAEPPEVVLPWVVYETKKGVSTLPSALPGQDYQVRGVIHQLEGGSQSYSLAINSLPEGVKVLNSTLSSLSSEGSSSDGYFEVALRLPKTLAAGVYPFSIQVLKGEKIVTASKALVPVEAVVDVIRVAAYNDFHGYIIPQWSSSLGTYSGALSMSFAIEELRDEVEEKDLVLVSAGDTVGASLFESRFNDDGPTKRIAKLWGTNAQAAGIHEFDRGWEDLVDSPTTFGFPVLSANIRKKADGSLFLKATHVETITRDGQDYEIGFVGVAPENLPSMVLASAIEGLEVIPAGPAAAEHAARLKAEGCDVVICLFHQGGRTLSGSKDTFMNAYPEAELTQFLRSINQDNTDIDILMTGQTHQLYNWNEASTINSKLPAVVQSEAFGTDLAVFDIKINRVTRSIALPPEVLLVSARQPISFDFKENRWVRGLDDPLSSAEVDALPKLVNDVKDEIIEAKKTTDAQGMVSQGRSNVLWPQPSNSETVLGVQVAAAMLAKAQIRDKDILMAFVNDGAIRKEWAPVEGHILARQVHDSLPFGYEAIAMTLTGADIKDVLEQQWSNNRVPSVLQLSGIRYEFDQINNAVGNRVDVTTMGYYNRSIDGFVPIRMDDKYRVVTNSFLANGGDLFVSFRKGEQVEDLQIIDNIYTSEYNVERAENNGGWIATPAYENAIDKTKDMKAFVNAIDRVSYDFANMESVATLKTKLIVTYQLPEWFPTSIPGPFRIILANWGSGEYFLASLKPEIALAPGAPITQEFHFAYGKEDEPYVDVILFHDDFDGAPFPWGLRRRLRLMPGSDMPPPIADAESTCPPCLLSTEESTSPCLLSTEESTCPPCLLSTEESKCPEEPTCPPCMSTQESICPPCVVSTLESCPACPDPECTNPEGANPEGANSAYTLVVGLLAVLAAALVM